MVFAFIFVTFGRHLLQLPLFITSDNEEKLSKIK